MTPIPTERQAVSWAADVRGAGSFCRDQVRRLSKWVDDSKARLQ